MITQDEWVEIATEIADEFYPKGKDKRRGEFLRDQALLYAKLNEKLKDKDTVEVKIDVTYADKPPGIMPNYVIASDKTMGIVKSAFFVPMVNEWAYAINQLPVDVENSEGSSFRMGNRYILESEIKWLSKLDVLKWIPIKEVNKDDDRA